MTYLVQKTNMFKQNMKIDDKITGSKMHTEQIWDSCTRIQHGGFTLTEFVIHYLHCLVKLLPVNLQSTAFVPMIIKILYKITYKCLAVIYCPLPQSDEIYYQLDVGTQQRGVLCHWESLPFPAAAPTLTPNTSSSGVTHVGTAPGALSALSWALEFPRETWRL